MSGRIVLDSGSPGKVQKELEVMFHEFIVGQDRAVRRLARRILYANSMTGHLRDGTKPAGSFFYLGPTGVGKTRLVEVFAYLLFGHFDAMLKIDCSELQHSHEMSRLIGAPPGYLGHDREPELSQRRLDYWGFMLQQDDSEFVEEIEVIKARINELEGRLQDLQQLKEGTGGGRGLRFDRRGLSDEERELNKEIKHFWGLLKQFSGKDEYKPGAYPAILLFDEIEKAHPALFDLLLQIHDKAKLTTHEMTGDGNNEVLFHNTFIFYTSNIGQRQLRKLIKNSSIGFVSGKISDNELDDTIYKTALEQLEKKFSPEFLGRIRKENIIVFSHLTRDQIDESLNRILIPQFIKRFSASFPVTIAITDAAKSYLVDESLDIKNRAFGMRALEGAFIKNIEEGLMGLAMKSEEEDGIVAGDEVWIDIKNGKLLFSVKERTGEQERSKKLVKKINRGLAEKKDYRDYRKIATFKIKKP